MGRSRRTYEWVQAAAQKAARVGLDCAPTDQEISEKCLRGGPSHGTNETSKCAASKAAPVRRGNEPKKEAWDRTKRQNGGPDAMCVSGHRAEGGCGYIISLCVSRSVPIAREKSGVRPGQVNRSLQKKEDHHV